MKQVREDDGIILQSIYTEFDTPGNISDADLVFQKIPDTEASITVKENSRISVTFNAIFMIFIDSSLTLTTAYNLSIVVQGYGNKSFTILYYQRSTTASKLLLYNFHDTFITDPLTAGTYKVELFWKSVVDPAGDNYLVLNDFLGMYIVNPRFLLLSELI
jgi:hypothetical protein